MGRTRDREIERESTRERERGREIFRRWVFCFLESKVSSKWVCSTQILLLCVGLVIRLPHIRFSQRQAICLEVLRARANFCRFWLIFKHPYSRTFSLTDSCVPCHEIINIFQSITTVFPSTLLSTNIRESFYSAFDEFYRIQSERICFTVKGACNIGRMLIQPMPTTIAHVTILQNQFAHSINSYRSKNLFSATFTKFVF